MKKLLPLLVCFSFFPFKYVNATCTESEKIDPKVSQTDSKPSIYDDFETNPQASNKKLEMTNLADDENDLDNNTDDTPIVIEPTAFDAPKAIPKLAPTVIKTPVNYTVALESANSETVQPKELEEDPLVARRRKLEEQTIQRLSKQIEIQRIKAEILLSKKLDQAMQANMQETVKNMSSE